ncbi:Nucleoid occlusion protein [subsurface metagenome]
MNLRHINLSSLDLPEFEAHNNIPEHQLTEISDSIKKIGVIEPVIVRKKNKRYEIVAGCIRYRAAKLAGLKAVPCIILSLSDDEAEIMKIHENLKRINLDHVDQGNTFIMLREKFNMTEEGISSIVGKSVSYISNHINLVSQDKELAADVKSGLLSFSQARELLKVSDIATRRYYQKYCEREGATVEILRQWIKEYKDRQAIDVKSEPSSSSTPIRYEQHSDLRICEACDKPTKITDIRQVFYCPSCHTAIKQAISDEKNKLPPKNHTDTHQERP